jgi:two-component system, NarL family, sensor histidine kinase FusK
MSDTSASIDDSAPAGGQLSGHPALVFLLVTTGYVAAATGSVIVGGTTDGLSLVWAPSGFAMGMVLLYGYRMVPAVFLGALLVRISTVAIAPGFVVMSAAAAALEPALCAFLLYHVSGFRPGLCRVRDVLGLMVFGVALTTMVTATIGTTGMMLGGVGEWASFGKDWRLWWAGDALGALVVAPVILVLTPCAKVRMTRWIIVEATTLVLSTILLGGLVYGGWTGSDLVYPLSFAVFPLVIWGALRFGQRGAVAVTALAVGLAVWGTSHGQGPFNDYALNVRMVYLYGFSAAIAVTGLLLGSAVTERGMALDELWCARRDLEDRVADRTAALQAELTEREKILHDLREALAKVKTLSGLLPICSSCKMIRDDRGYWTQVERYISAHSEAQFSHGICPACMKALYPEVAERTPPAGPATTPGTSAAPRPTIDGSTET